jgi:hypothetical protein
MPIPHELAEQPNRELGLAALRRSKPHLRGFIARSGSEITRNLRDPRPGGRKAPELRRPGAARRGRSAAPIGAKPPHRVRHRGAVRAKPPVSVVFTGNFNLGLFLIWLIMSLKNNTILVELWGKRCLNARAPRGSAHLP